MVKEKPEDAAESVGKPARISLDYATDNSQMSAYHDANRADIRDRRSLKTGILSAMIHAMIQPVRAIAIHDPTERKVRLDMCLVPRNSRTYLDMIYQLNEEASRPV